MTKHKIIGKSGYEYVSSYDEIVNHTIERCAQIAEDYKKLGYVGFPEIVAAAIRELKIKP